MNKHFKAFGKGMIYGVKHPFRQAPPARYFDMSLTEALCDSLGVAIVQTTAEYGIFIGGLIAIGYANDKIKNKPVKVKMVVDPTKK